MIGFDALRLPAALRRSITGALSARFPQSVLLIGAEEQTRALGRTIAAALLCEHGCPCGACGSCRKAEKGIHPDLIEVEEEGEIKVEGEELSLGNLAYLLDRMGSYIIRQEVAFCELDSHAGDGDFGMSVAKGFRRLKAEWKEIAAESGDIGELLTASAFVIMEHCGGASGPIWGSAFLAAGRETAGKRELSCPEFARMLQAAVVGVQRTGERSFGRGAVVGDKTLIDALVPCAQAWQEAATLEEGFRLGAEAAVRGAKETEKIAARMGRAGTVGERSIGYPDAGAYALGQIFTYLYGQLRF